MTRGGEAPRREVLAIRYGTLAATKGQLYHRFATYGDRDGPQALDYYLYVVRDAETTTVIDTGFDPRVGVRRGRTCLRPPTDALERVGVDPASVERLVLSHLHYDHIGNVAAFSAATIHVPERELEFWTGEAARRTQFAEHVEAGEIDRLVSLRRTGRIATYAGPCRLAPGIEAVALGGHSPGQHAFVVDTGATAVVLASDAVHLYDEIELDRPFSVIADLEAMYRAYDTLRGLSDAPGAVLVPGHDPAVATRFPSLPGLEGVAMRLGAP